MSFRAMFSTLVTFGVGLAGGAAGAHWFAPGALPATIDAAPAVAREVRVPALPGADGIADLVDAVKVAVVNIDTVSHRRVMPSQVDLFRQFFDDRMPAPEEREEKGVGSGFILEENGLIVTNHHVVRGADKLTVTLSDGRKLPGKVVGQDPGTDLALVRVSGKGLPTLKLADPGSLRVGQYVVAVGSPLGLSQTVTSGILSAINRDISLNARVGFLQTDAPINPGNSGGPLLNLRGEVIGVNTAIAARGQGIGFAIPVDTLKTVLPQLEARGKVDRPWLGVGVAPLPEDRSGMFYPAQYGVLVGRVEPNSPASRAGLRPGDIIMTLNDTKLNSPAELVRTVAKIPIGDTVKLLVSRQGQERSFAFKLDRMPEKMATTNDENTPGE